MSDFALVKHD